MLGLAGRTTAPAALGLWVPTTLVAAIGAALTLVAWSDLAPADAFPNLGAVFAGVLYAGLVALVVRRVRNLIGWILVGEGFGLALLSFTSAYSVVGIVTHPGSLPFPHLVGLTAELVFVPLTTGLAFLFLFFPTGTLPSPRWRPVVALGIVASALALAGYAVTPHVVALPAPGGVSLTFPNPLGVQSLGHVLTALGFGSLSGLGVLVAALLLGAFAADELLGALALRKPRNEALSMTEDKLLHDLASQAGLVLRNVRLTTELQASIEKLRASRRRLVEAQDSERRKLERNLHDGAQQQLVAVRVQLGLLERFAEDSDRVKQMTRLLQDALQEALDDLRDLARGIFPPLLADRGLAVALEAQGRKAPVATTVESDGVGRYPQEIEATVYFCALEAMQNVAKYAEASSATVRIAERDGDLIFEVQDDGRGFDAGGTTYGTGLRGMADRIDAIGGSLEVSSAPGRGTLVRGRVKLT